MIFPECSNVPDHLAMNFHFWQALVLLHYRSCKNPHMGCSHVYSAVSLLLHPFMFPASSFFSPIQHLQGNWSFLYSLSFLIPQDLNPTVPHPPSAPSPTPHCSLGCCHTPDTKWGPLPDHIPVGTTNLGITCPHPIDSPELSWCFSPSPTAASVGMGPVIGSYHSLCFQLI